MAKKKKADAADERKPVTIEPLAESHGHYALMYGLIHDNHPHLEDARIALAWRMSKAQADVDGQIEFGRVKRAADLDRAFAEHDFVLVMTHEVWNRAEADEDRVSAMMDWLLCQCMPAMKDGEQQVDEKDRLCWRLRKPIKVYPENVGRFGLWNAEPVDEANKRYHDSQRKLLPQENEPAASGRKRRNGFGDPAIPPGATSTTTPGGIREHDPETAGVGE